MTRGVEKERANPYLVGCFEMSRVTFIPRVVAFLIREFEVVMRGFTRDRLSIFGWGWGGLEGSSSSSRVSSSR